ncbi:NADPH-dependent oxidoreductase [Frigidibacter sp. MR17.24]|uniref:NADPH-dependent oxidoreductase n=1 Tax=Frigidibacter sp. MR17.24 TaxID=3127345 RepID=UPI003012B248
MKQLFESRATDTPAPDVAMNEVLRGLLGRSSCRAYADRPVPPGTLQALALAAQSAPSSSNLQCWSVVAVTDPGPKAALNAVSGQQRHVDEAPVLLCFLADLSRVETLADDAGMPTDSLAYLEMFLMAAIDASLAAQNLATAAEAMGLGTCCIGGMRNDIDTVGALLGLPRRVVPVFGMTLGYPDPARPAAVKPRLPTAAVLHLGRYRTDDLADQIRTYDQRLAGFDREQGRPVAPWTQRSAERISDPARMQGRQDLLARLAARRLACR